MALLDRMVLAVERVRDRLSRSTKALENAGIPYAVTDGNAVAFIPSPRKNTGCGGWLRPEAMKFLPKKDLQNLQRQQAA